MLYDTISGLLNAPSNHYDAGQDLSSQKYRFHRKDLTTMLGEHNLLEDPDGGPEQ
jgi:heptose-I-phosphate ethanolaminephosphotransferase